MSTGMHMLLCARERASWNRLRGKRARLTSNSYTLKWWEYKYRRVVQRFIYMERVCVCVCACVISLGEKMRVATFANVKRWSVLRYWQKFMVKATKKRFLMWKFLKITDSRISVWGKVNEKLFKFRAEIYLPSKIFEVRSLFVQLSVHIRFWKVFLSRFQEGISHWIETDLANIYIYQRERLDHKFRNYSIDTKLHNPIQFVASWLSRSKICKRNKLCCQMEAKGWNKRAGMNCPMANVLATDSPLVPPPLHFFE